MIQLEATPIAAALEKAVAVMETPATREVTPTEAAMKVAERKLKAHLAKPRKGVKPAAKEPAKPKAPAAASELYSEIREGAELLESITGPNTFIAKAWGQFGKESLSIKIPAWDTFKESLPAEGAGPAIKLFHTLRESMATFFGPAKQTWVIHFRGSVAIYGKLAR